MNDKRTEKGEKHMEPLISIIFAVGTLMNRIQTLTR